MNPRSEFAAYLATSALGVGLILGLFRMSARGPIGKILQQAVLVAVLFFGGGIGFYVSRIWARGPFGRILRHLTLLIAVFFAATLVG